MNWLFERPVVITLAIIGGALSLAAMLMQNKSAMEQWIRRFNLASYFFMGASVVLFIIAGLRAGRN